MLDDPRQSGDYNPQHDRYADVPRPHRSDSANWAAFIIVFAAVALGGLAAIALGGAIQWAWLLLGQ